MGQLYYLLEYNHCSICRCGTWSRSPVWDRAAKRPIPCKFTVQVNAWLLEHFDLGAQGSSSSIARRFGEPPRPRRLGGGAPTRPSRREPP